MAKAFKVIVVGCGVMSREWIRYAVEHAPEIEIQALVDIVPAAAEKRSQEFGLNVPIYSDLSEALDRTEANLAFDITLPENRESVVGTALSRGLDVLSEKPMADSWAGARRLVEQADRLNRRFIVMQNRRYNPAIRRLQSLLQSGTIGQTGFAAADFFLGPHFGGFREAMDHPLLLDMAIHTFDQARFILQSDPVSVYCHAFNPPGSWYRGNAAAIAIFEWENQITFEYRGSWAAEGAPTSWESSWRITGSEGTALWDGESDPYAEIVDHDLPAEFIRKTKRIAWAPPWPHQSGHRGCLDAMFAALSEGKPAETEAVNNLGSVAMVFGAIESAQSGRPVSLSDR